MGPTQFNLSKNICFYKYAHNSGARGSPDMILTAFDMKFQEKKDELPPEAWNPQATNLKKTHTQKQQMQTKMGPPEPPAARAGSPGGGSPRGSGLNSSVTSGSTWINDSRTTNAIHLHAWRNNSS